MAPLVAALGGPLLDIVGGLIDRAFPDSTEREAKRLEYGARITEAITKVDMAQLEVNKIEAGSASMFVAGWRPFIGWVCGFAFVYHYIVQPLAAFVMTAYGHPVSLPAFDMEAMMYVLFGMLGLGTMRTFEKGKGLTAGLSGQLPWRKKDE